MIQANEPDKQITEKPQLDGKDLLKALFICVESMGGSIGIPNDKIKNFPSNTEFDVLYDEKCKMWVFITKRPQKKEQRGILMPNRRLIC